MHYPKKMNPDKKHLQEAQYELMQGIIEKTNLNIVTCGMCSAVIIHDRDDEEVHCPYCDFGGEPSDFPDLIFKPSPRETEDEKIAIEWSIQDVYYQAKNDEVEITRQQALNVLSLLDRKHDATLGICWDTISMYINMEING